MVSGRAARLHDAKPILRRTSDAARGGSNEGPYEKAAGSNRANRRSSLGHHVARNCSRCASTSSCILLNRKSMWGI